MCVSVYVYVRVSVRVCGGGEREYPPLPSSHHPSPPSSTYPRGSPRVPVSATSLTNPAITSEWPTAISQTRPYYVLLLVDGFRVIVRSHALLGHPRLHFIACALVSGSSAKRFFRCIAKIIPDDRSERNVRVRPEMTSIKGGGHSRITLSGELVWNTALTHARAAARIFPRHKNAPRPAVSQPQKTS